jgi:hypothetical protein
MYFPAFGALNDPFDGKLHLDFGGSPEGIRKFWYTWRTRSDKQLPVPLEEIIQKSIDRRDDPATQARSRETLEKANRLLGVVSFSELPDDIPMWAYYAGSQQGVCLRFNARLLLGWERCFPPMPVSYLNQYPEVSFYGDSQFHRMRMGVAAKARAWKHEREWRIVRLSGAGHVTFDPLALDGIVMGCGIAPADEALLREMVKSRKPPVELFKALPARRRYKLDIVSA